MRPNSDSLLRTVPVVVGQIEMGVAEIEGPPPDLPLRFPRSFIARPPQLESTVHTGDPLVTLRREPSECEAYAEGRRTASISRLRVILSLNTMALSAPGIGPL
jgi:hypothetical protein